MDVVKHLAFYEDGIRDDVAFVLTHPAYFVSFPSLLCKEGADCVNCVGSFLLFHPTKIQFRKNGWLPLCFTPTVTLLWQREGPGMSFYGF